jgi:hypothetical protein
MKQKITIPNVVLMVLAVLAVGYSAYLALFYAGQPPLDIMSFRQTQTALTAYWFVQEGYKLAYETPVGGAPWTIPFELPLYQFIVAAISDVFDFSLDSVGRIVSYLFLVACLVPVRAISIKLQLDRAIFYIFVALLFSSPIYLYWGRSFMIETAALFFSISAIKYFIDGIVDGFNRKCIILFVTLVTFAVLQKATTALPVLAVLSFVYLYCEGRKWQISSNKSLKRLIGIALICFALPIILGFLWVYFTDQVKLSSPLGPQLTSSALKKWNWGTFEQRTSHKLFFDIIWVRIFSSNLGGQLGLFVISLPFIIRSSSRLRFIAAVLLMLGAVPLFLFTNLHIVHDYYQSANVIFIIFVLAVSLGGVILPRCGFAVTSLVLLIIMFSNYACFAVQYKSAILENFTKENRDVAIGAILKREVPVGGQFVALGNDWSSTFSYMAQRKSFTAPNWFKDYSLVLSAPDQFVDQGKLGAVVFCGSQMLGVADIIQFASKRSWKTGETNGCLLATPQQSFIVEKASKVQCQGSIDRAIVEQRDGNWLISISGWSTLYGTKSDFPSSVFVVISSGDGNNRYLEALRVPKLEVNRSLGVSDEEDAGFSLLFPASLPVGEYHINIVQANRNKYGICQFNKALVISEGIYEKL